MIDETPVQLDQIEIWQHALEEGRSLIAEAAQAQAAAKQAQQLRHWSEAAEKFRQGVRNLRYRPGLPGHPSRDRRELVPRTAGAARPGRRAAEAGPRGAGRARARTLGGDVRAEHYCGGRNAAAGPGRAQ